MTVLRFALLKMLVLASVGLIGLGGLIFAVQFYPFGLPDAYMYFVFSACLGSVGLFSYVSRRKVEDGVLSDLDRAGCELAFKYFMPAELFGASVSLLISIFKSIS